MRRNGSKLLTITLVATFLVGCSSMKQSTSADTSPSSTKEESIPSKSIDTVSSISFSDWSYDDEDTENRFPFSLEVPSIPEEYYEPSEQQGNLEYFYYDTIDYDNTSEEEEKYAIVYTPYGYDDTKSYDIFYLVHGSGQYAESFFGYPGQETEFKNIVDHMIENKQMNPMIIVCISYYDFNEEEWNDDEDAQIVKNFGFEFENDILPTIEESYSTYAASTSIEDLIASRNHRIFGGFSMGGVSTWYRFMDCMPYIRYYMPISGMLEWGPDVTEESDEPEWEGSLLKDSLIKNGYSATDFDLYIATGGYDYARPYLEKQICSLTNYPDIFLFGSQDDENVNCFYAYNPDAEHTIDDILPYFYQALPIFSTKINALSKTTVKGD